MFLNFEVPKKKNRHGTTTTTFIGGQGGPGTNSGDKGLTIDEAFIAAGGFGKRVFNEIYRQISMVHARMLCYGLHFWWIYNLHVRLQRNKT